METISEAVEPALAKKLQEWFPDLNNRCMAVSDMELLPQNPPTLPIAIVAHGDGTFGSQSNKNRPAFIDDIVVEFWFEPKRVKSGMAETPFYTFYDYHYLRKRLLSHIIHWLTPANSTLLYRGVAVQATTYAVIVTFKFRHEEFFCDEFDDPEDGKPLRVNMKIC